jgi:xylulokinase
MYTLGYDIGSSSVKASLIHIETGKVVAAAFSPQTEMPISVPHTGHAEQHPDLWWENLQAATAAAVGKIVSADTAPALTIKAIGISYQMHGLVCVDADGQPLRPAIIWCDSRATELGRTAFTAIGAENCLARSLNSPGNFTASKLAWVKQHEPQIYDRIHKIMLPGDYIAYRLTGEMQTTVSGLSEMMLWDFSTHTIAHYLLDYYGISADLLPPVVPTFGEQGRLSAHAAKQLGLAAGTPISYRAGDQPNNALSLGVLRPGDIAATAGTSGVVYGVSEVIRSDAKGRIGTFAHVNHSDTNPRLGLLLCINGTGSLNAYMRRTIARTANTYAEMNTLAMTAPIGSEGLCILPFGNGAERILEDADTGASLHGLRFFTHTEAHLLRAAQEGIAFSFRYGIDLMRAMGMNIRRIHAGEANLFLSPLFAEAVANLSGAEIELYNTDGAAGAARGAALGMGIYADAGEAFSALQCVARYTPTPSKQAAYAAAYEQWLTHLHS